MNRIDKETLSDLYMSIKELVNEAHSLLRLEAAKDVYNRAKLSWLAEMETALGDNRYTNPFKTSFWITLEELGILNVNGMTDDADEISTAEIDDYDEAWIREWNQYIKSDDQSKEQEDNEIESYDEVVFDAVPSQDGDGSTDLSNAQLVEASPLEDKKATAITKSSTKWEKENTYHRTTSDLVYTKYDRGNTEHLYNEKWHQVNGPAIIRANGDKFWYRHGILTRTDGPAIDLVTGHKEWWVDGKLHREDGSAIEHADGITGKGYALFGQIFDNKREWEAAKAIRCMKTSTALVLVSSVSTEPNIKLPLIYA